MKMIERSGVTTFQGKPLTLIGPALNAGRAAPEFVLTANDLSDLRSDAYRGKLLVLSVVPSLDTPVCATQTRTFNQRATGLGEDVVVLTVSMDLPFAQKPFCGAEGIQRVVTASDYKHRSFGPAYGVLIKELGLLARAVFVVDRAGKVTYSEYVPEVTQEPNYDAALEALKAAK
jgi:thiol peroxidase